MRMMPVIEQIKEMLSGQVDIYQLDVDKNSELCEVEKITATPTFIIYRDGRRVWRDSGEMGGDELLDKIQSFMS